jgi:hypothetical protein
MALGINAPLFFSYLKISPIPKPLQYKVVKQNANIFFKVL